MWRSMIVHYTYNVISRWIFKQNDLIVVIFHIIIITHYYINQDDDNYGATSFYIYISFPLFKIFFLTCLATLAHTAHADLVVDFPLFSSFLIFTPRQQGWLASTISCPLACNSSNNTQFY